MSRILTLLAAAALGGATVYFAFQYHVVRADEGVFIVPKRAVGLSETYVDVRNWSALDWEKRPALVEALVRDGRGDIIPTTAGRSLLRGVLDRLAAPAADRPRRP